jgi:membrane-associated phospholipid phosphatase
MGPGVYAEFREHSSTPEGFVFGAGYAAVKPFALSRPDQFRVAPPPAIDSKQYTAAFKEVKDVGSFASRTRTADQTHLAMWWKEFAEASHNRLARDLVLRDRLELRRAVRLFALLNMSIFDGYVSSFDSKFFYNHWRPYTAIHRADQDGNPATDPDAQWNNLHNHTYPFPSYPSAHGTVCGAAMTVMADTFGKKRRFTMETPEVDKAGPMSGKIPMNPPTRSFASFRAAAMECALSRVYLGIHFRYDALAGNELGNDVGRYALEKYLARL